MGKYKTHTQVEKKTKKTMAGVPMHILEDQVMYPITMEASQLEQAVNVKLGIEEGKVRYERGDLICRTLTYERVIPNCWAILPEVFKDGCEYFPNEATIVLKPRRNGESWVMHRESGERVMRLLQMKIRAEEWADMPNGGIKVYVPLLVEISYECKVALTIKYCLVWNGGVHGWEEYYKKRCVDWIWNRCMWMGRQYTEILYEVNVLAPRVSCLTRIENGIRMLNCIESAGVFKYKPRSRLLLLHAAAILEKEDEDKTKKKDNEEEREKKGKQQRRCVTARQQVFGVPDVVMMIRDYL